MVQVRLPGGWIASARRERKPPPQDVSGGVAAAVEKGVEVGKGLRDFFQRSDG